MSLSEYSTRLRARVDGLLRALVARVCDLQPWEANFAIALDFCTFHTRRHPFPEPDAGAITAAYASLCERFGVAAQLEKRAALETLLQRFAAAPMQCEAPDGHARVLALLHALAGAPLRSPHDGAAFAAVLARLDGGAAEAEAAARRAAGRAPQDALPPPPEEAEEARPDRPASEADTLSDWSDDDDNQAAAATAAAVAARQQAAAVAAAAAAAAERAAAAAAAEAARAASNAAAADRRAAAAALAPRVGPPCAASRVSEAALAAALPGAAAAGAEAVAEAALARSCLRALRGAAPMPPPEALAAARVPHLSPGALAALTSRVAEAAAAAAGVAAFCAAAAEHRDAGAAVRALAAYLDAALAAARDDALAALERRAASTAPSAGGVTLLEAAHAAAQLAAAATPLRAVRDAAAPRWLLRSAGLVAEASAEEAADAAADEAALLALGPVHAAAADAARCLDGAWRCVAAGCADGDAARRLLRAATSAFAAAAGPQLRALHAWLRDGELHDDPRGELPVAPGAGRHVIDADPAAFWDDGFTARPPRAVAAVLAPLLPALLAAGKSRALLRHARGRATAVEAAAAEAAAAEAEAAEAAAQEEAPLEEVVCAALREALEGGMAGCASDYESGADPNVDVERAAAAASRAAAEAREAADAAASRLVSRAALPPAECAAPAWPQQPASHAALRLPISAGGSACDDAADAAAAAAVSIAWVAPCGADARSRALASGGAAARLAAWLAVAPLPPPPPPQLLLSRALHAHLRRRAAAASAALVAALRTRWGLAEELTALRAVFLGWAPGFAAALLAGIEAADAAAAASGAIAPQPRWRDAAGALEAALTSWVPLEAALAPAVGRVAALPAPPPVASADAEPAAAAGAEASPLAGVRITMRVAWPLGAVVPPADVERYGRVLAALLAVRRAAAALDSASAARRRGKGGHGAHPLPPELALALAEAALFVKALEEHLATRVLAPAVAGLDAALGAAGDLDGIRAAHGAYLAAVCRGALVAPDALWTLLAPRVRRLLQLAPRLAAAARDGGASPAAAADAAACRTELRATLRTLAQKLRAGGPAQQMADCEGLLARLDFNSWFTATAGEADDAAAAATA